MAATQENNPTPGPGVDRQGRNVVDPSQNVLDLVDAAVKRLDDLRVVEVTHRRELDKQRNYYEEKLRLAESMRIDAIRAVDVGNVNRAAEVQAAAAGVLAAQLVATQEQSRSQVAAVAGTFQTGLVAALEPMQKDIRDLRDAQSRGAGGVAQVGETRLNFGSVLGGLAFLIFLAVFIIAVVR